MADAHKFNGSLEDSIKVFPDLPWQRKGGKSFVYDSKAGEYVQVSKGQFIYKVGDRFEVRDTEELPKSAKPATEKDEKPVERAKAKAEEAKAEEKSEED